MKICLTVGNQAIIASNEATVNIVKLHYALNERHKVLVFVET